MALADLRQTLEDAIVGQSLELNSANTGIAVLDDVVQDIGDALPIKDVVISLPSDSELHLEGTTSFLNVQTLRVTAIFIEDASGYQMRLQARITGSWAFVQSFPELGSTDLDSLTLQDTSFVLSTYADDDYVQGLNFDSTLVVEGPLSPIADLLGESASVALGGSIDTSGAKPVFDFYADFQDLTASVGGIELNQLALHVYTQENEDTSAIEAGFEFAAAVVVSDNVSIEVLASIEAGSNELQLAGNFENLALPGLDDIASLVSGRDLASLLPDNLQSGTNFVVDSFAMTIILSPLSLSYFNIQLSFNKDGGTETAWSVGADLLTVQSIGIEIEATDPLTRDRVIKMAVDGLIILVQGEIVITALLDDGFSLTGTLNEDTSIELGDLLTTFDDSVPVPESDNGTGLAITSLDMSASPRYNTYSINAEISDVWSLNIGFSTLAVERFAFSFDYTPNDLTVSLDGDVTFQPEIFDRLTLNATYADSTWSFLATATNIQIANLIEQIIGTGIELEAYGLDIVINELSFYLRLASKSDTTIQRLVQLSADFTWNTGIDFGGAIDPIVVDAYFEIEKEGTDSPSGMVSGSIDLADLSNLNLSAEYAFGTSSELKFIVALDDLKLTATYSTDSKSTILFEFETSKSISAADLLTYVVKLVDPTIEYFQLDPPWDEIFESIAFDLSSISVELDFAQKSISFGIDLNFNVLSGLIIVNSIALTYNKKASISATLTSDLLGMDEESIEWDAMDESPPAVPGKGATVFDLQYLALGQRVVFNDPTAITIPTIMAALQDAVGQDTDDTNVLPTVLAFDRDAGWFIGAKFKILDTLDLSMIFNDPVLYGVRIELSGEMAKSFAGLVFEILYRRISDTIGVYHIELVLPDVMRQLEFGAVSVTLPIVVIDIYTNGDFKLDLGFPWNSDFSRSFAIQAFPFTGAGGFYFNKLSAATASESRVPSITNGSFNPILEFGIGLKIGLGKSFNKGPLRAEFSITVQGILQGVIAWYYPDGSPESTDEYYYIEGSISIVGRIYGAVDFKVIRVDVEVIARATAAFIVEAYQPSLIELSASVSVRASIKIVFVRIHFSFSLSVKESFTIGSASTPPWIEGTRDPLSLPAAGDLAIRKTAPTYAPFIMELPVDSTPAFKTITVASRTPTALNWQVVQVFETGTLPELTVYFQPAYTRSNDGLNIVMLTFMENAIPVEATDTSSYEVASENVATARATDFNYLVQALLTWAIYAQYTPPEGEASESDETWTLIGDEAGGITREHLAYLLDSLSTGNEDPDNPLTYEQVLAFLKLNFTAVITDAKSDTSASIFPIMPNLVLQYGDETVKFSEQTITQTDLERYASYFASLQPGEGSNPVLQADEGELSVADFILVDYVLLIMRTAVQSAIDYFDDNAIGDASVLLETILNAITENGSMNHIAAIASRFLLHGLRLPESDDSMTPLYKKSGQQIVVTVADVTPVTTETTEDDGSITETTTYFDLILTKDADPDDAYSWLSFNDVDDSSTTQLTYRIEDETALKALGDLTDEQISTVLPTITPAWKSFYETVNRIFTLHDMPSVTAPNTANACLVDLPSGMRTALLNDTNATYTVSDRSTGEALTDYDWLTQIDISIQRIPSNDGTALLPNTYLLQGMDEDERDLLLQIYTAITGNSNLSADLTLLLDNALISDGTTRLLKTNLSTTTSNSVSTYDATLDDAENFIKLLWQSSTIAGGGYYLYYADSEGNGLPDTVFNDGERGVISLLMMVLDSNVAAGDESSVVDVYSTSLLARFTESETVPTALTVESSATVQVPSLKAGIAAFDLTRTNPDTDEFDDTGDELAHLYQMLGYLVSGSASDDSVLNAESLNREALPIGPADDDVNWLYERMIPLYKFIDAGDTNLIPLAINDPYLGIGEDVSLGITFWWQDIYGNRLDAANFDNSLTIVPKYRDPLIGFAQFPGLALSYSFSKDNSDAQMAINFEFEQSQYVPSSSLPFTEAMNRIEAALETYTTIVYQMRHMDDLTFTVKSSVMTGDTGSIAFSSKDGDTRPADIQNFAQSTYDFFLTLQQVEAYQHTVADGDTLESLANQYDTTVAAIAEANSSAYDLLLNAEVTIDNETHILESGDTLTNYAAAYKLTVSEIATQNKAKNLNTAVEQADGSAGVIVIPARVVLPDDASGTTTIDSNTQQLNQLANSSLIADMAEWIASNISLVNVLAANSNIATGDAPSNWRFTATQWSALVSTGIAVTTDDTFSAIMSRISDAMGLSASDTFGADDLAGVLQSQAVFAAGAKIIAPPAEFDLIVNFQNAIDNYPDELIFPVTAAITMARDAALVDDTLANADIESASATIAPRSRSLADTSSNYQLSLSEFATGFEATFDELHLAIGSSEDDSIENAALWAVHIGDSGFKVDISTVNPDDKDSLPYYFTAQPLANTLLSDTVPLATFDSESDFDENTTADERFEAIDMNVWAEQFLSTVQQIISPDYALPAMNLGTNAADLVRSILGHKETLSEAIRQQVTNILETSIEIESYREQAAELLEQRLRIHLADAYKIETLIQYNVTVTKPESKKFPNENPARLVGKPFATNMNKRDGSAITEQPDFSLSSAKIPLDSDTAHLTFFFDTQQPEKHADVILSLVFRANEIQFDIQTGIGEYENSKWLTFINPLYDKEALQDNFDMGSVDIPVPLRTYPMPPSLVQQTAVADPDAVDNSSAQNLRNVREWAYQYTFEHLDIAQDSIENYVQYNYKTATTLDTTTAEVQSSREALFEALANYIANEAAIEATLQDLTSDDPAASQVKILRGLDAFNKLMAEVATTWLAWSSSLVTERSTDSSMSGTSGYDFTHFDIIEGDPDECASNENVLNEVKVEMYDDSTLKGVDYFPLIHVPYMTVVDTKYSDDGESVTYCYEERSEEDLLANPEVIFGESSIPDRTATIENLDIIEQQSAWAAIRLIRNKFLNDYFATNPVFIYQTPQVRFSNAKTPYLVNNTDWNIGELVSSGTANLADYIRAMFDAVLPETAGRDYTVQVGVRYGFSMVGTGEDALRTTVPVLLGLRLLIAATSTMSDITAPYVEKMADAIEEWIDATDPQKQDGLILFTVMIFAGLEDETPLLRINDIMLDIDLITATLQQA